MLLTTTRWLQLTMVIALATNAQSLLEKDSKVQKPESLRSSDHGSVANHWSTEPTCSASNPTYCVFSSTSFANGRGLSMLVTPEQAAEISTLPAFTDPTIHQDLGVNQHSNPPFVAIHIKGHGVGLIANRTIQPGEWLMSYSPAFFKARQSHDDLSFHDRLELQRLAFSQLPLPLRDTANNLYGQSEGRVDHVNDILETNSFALTIPLVEGSEASEESENSEDSEDEGEVEEVQFDFLFPEIARLNHNCRPSADYYFDTTTLTLHIVAFRPIFAGEEITITYIDPLQRRRARQKALWHSWGFRCDCALCTASPQDCETSDARIDQISELRQELEDRSHESEADPAMGEKLLSLLRQEHLWTLLHDAYAATAFEYNGVGDVVNAQKYALMGMQSGLTCRSSDNYNEDYRNLQELMDDPSSHPSWMFRSSV